MHFNTEFCENQLSGFCVILLTKKQTNASGNKTSLAQWRNHSSNVKGDESLSGRRPKARGKGIGGFPLPIAAAWGVERFLPGKINF